VTAHRKWPTGIYMVWYPLKDRREAIGLERRIRRALIAKVLRAELTLAEPRPDRPLTATALIVVSPPWTLPGELARMLEGLQILLAKSEDAGFRLDWLSGEN
jgi:23S rRNA (adenine2030-N6)-methyltransferase